MKLTWIKSDLKYVVVVLLFFGFFIFGRNLGPADQITKNQQNQEKGIYLVRPQSKPVSIKMQDSYKKGESNRLLLDVNVNDMGKPIERRPIDFSLSLVSDYGKEQLIGKVSLDASTQIAHKELKFTAEFDASNLIVKRIDSRSTGDVVISNIRSFRLDSLAGLRPTIIGMTDNSKVVFETADEFDGGFPFVFTRQDQRFGQIFIADTERVSSVDVALKWVGSGGSGNYVMELSDITEIDGDYSLVDNSLARTFFNQKILQDKLTGVNTYRIPFSANLTIGKKYAVTMSNANVSFNIINTLKVGGTKSQDKTMLPGITGIKGARSRTISQLYFRLNGLESSLEEAESILGGAVIQDLGGGKGLYTYDSKDLPMDFYDIYKPSPGTVYDNILGGIIAPLAPDSSFIYRFQTIYPFSKIKVILNQSIGQASGNIIHYSFDEKDWILIDQNYDGNLILEKILTPKVASKEMYIKVTYDPEDAKYKGSTYFGLKNIKVRADLSIPN